MSADLSDLIITGGSVTGAQVGGGVYSYGGTVSLTDCIVSGNSAYEGGGIYISQGTLTLNDVTITNNTAKNNQGAGLFNSVGTATLINCAISGNSGGGVENQYATASLTDCTLTGNTGGGLLDFYSSATLDDCTISGNTAQFGAGIFNQGGDATVIDCTISGNTATTNGGGLFSQSGYLTLTDSTFSGNVAGSVSTSGSPVRVIVGPLRGYGGGLFTVGGADLMTDCTISNNTSSTKGGGLFTEDTADTLTTSTFSGNSAGSGSGGGLFSQGSYGTMITCTISGNSAGTGGGLAIQGGNNQLVNCTIAGNTATTSVGGLTSSGAYDTLINTIVAANTNTKGASDIGGTDTIWGSNDLIGTGGSGGLVNGVNGNIVGVANPGLAPLGNYGGPTETMALLPGSLAIDAGTTSVIVPATDQRGLGRVGAVDIGSVESQGYVLTVATGSTPQSTLNGTTFANPLTVTRDGQRPARPGHRRRRHVRHSSGQRSLGDTFDDLGNDRRFRRDFGVGDRDRQRYFRRLHRQRIGQRRRLGRLHADQPRQLDDDDIVCPADGGGRPDGHAGGDGGTGGQEPAHRPATSCSWTARP